MKRSHLFFAALVLIGSSLMAQAPVTGIQTTTPKREQRAEGRANRQQARIIHGQASGQLTAKETARLEHREAKIDRDIHKAEADGKITKKEAGKIHQEQNRTSRQIRHEKHDAQTRK